VTPSGSTRGPAGGSTSRELALDVLVRVEEGAYSNVLLPATLRRSSLDARDRAFATELVYGTLREQRALDWLISHASDRPVDALEPVVRAGLRLGTYQLVHGVSAHAAVSETVDTVARRRDRARGFVNAVLRAVARDLANPAWPEGDATEALGVRTSHPDWIVDELVATVGVDDARRVLEADNRVPAVTLRVAPGVDRAEVERELAAAGAEFTSGRLVSDALVVRGIGDPKRLPAVSEGRATPQDQASQAVVGSVDPQPGDRVLDVAAAPGGKSTGLASLVGPAGLVVACDLHASRAGLIGTASRRLRLGNVVVAVADGRRLPFGPGVFDRVLLDAPCSGLGVLRRRAEARWRIQPRDVETLAALQRELLREAALAVRPGGRLVYSVCTLTTAETLAVDEWAAAHLDEFLPATLPAPPWRPWGRGALLLPGDADTDGMFVLELQRR